MIAAFLSKSNAEQTTMVVESLEPKLFDDLIKRLT
jgi:hypothetical protein